MENAKIYYIIKEMTMKIKGKQKPAYRRIRLPAIKRSGAGAHQPDKGGKYRRSKEIEILQREIKAELE